MAIVDFCEFNFGLIFQQYIHPDYMTPLKARDPKLVLPEVSTIDDKDKELPTPVRRSYRLDSIKKAKSKHKTSSNESQSTSTDM
jgi:hypothetical protein